jgi:hypothetical protein
MQIIELLLCNRLAVNTDFLKMISKHVQKEAQ